MKISKLKSAFASEAGAIMPFVVILFLTMVVMAGMGVDFMRHEAARADLQNALDRGVLAAAARTQTLAQQEEGMSDAEFREAKEELIASYMKSRTFRSEEPRLDVEIPDDLDDDETAVEASARYDMNTFFLKIAGFNQMAVPAQSYAEQRKLDLEISLVLDISGSMGDPDKSGERTKLAAVKEAVYGFIDQLLTSDTVDQTLISIIPYGNQVNTTPLIADVFKLEALAGFVQKRNEGDAEVNNLHPYSYCFDFSTEGSGSNTTVQDNPDFNQIPIQGSGTTLRQYQHLKQGSRFVCPSANNSILAYSNDSTALKEHVAGLTSGGWTTTFNGIKWGMALLDPSSEILTSRMIKDGSLASTFEGRPASYNENNIKKYLVVLSDGRNTNQVRVASDTDYYTPTEGATTEELLSEQLARLQYWNDTSDGSSYVVNSREGDTLTNAICAEAKSEGGTGNLTIFTIGYDLQPGVSGTAEAIAVLKGCSSDEAKDFYNVLGNDNPADAFDAIAARINLLKLAQNER